MNGQFVAEVDAAVSVNTGEPNVSAFSSGNEGRIEEIKISNVGHFLIGPSPAANLVGYYRKDRTNPSALKSRERLVPGFFS